MLKLIMMMVSKGIIMYLIVRIDDYIWWSGKLDMKNGKF